MKRRLSYSCYTEVRCATVVATLSSAAAVGSIYASAEIMSTAATASVVMHLI